MRLVLVYNLVWVGLGKVPSAAADRRVQECLQKAYKLWEEELATGSCYGLVAFRLGECHSAVLFSMKKVTHVLQCESGCLIFADSCCRLTC